MRRSSFWVVLAFVAVVLFPSLASAQASITGVVKDASGAVLPGVTVEASSPALIEKVRTATTDGAGQYRVADLRPGTYSVTFTLPGFSVVRRDGLELAGSFAATVDASLRVGALQETITVTGESPVVDVQNTTAQRALTKEVLDAIPAGRSHLTQAILVPGVTTTQGSARGNLVDVGGTQNLQNTLISVHGGRVSDTRVQIDGVRIGNMSGAGQWHNFVPDQGATQEVVIDYGAVSAEEISGGLRINYVPREGGNSYKGNAFFTLVNQDWQQNNISDELRAAGLSEPNRLRRMYDINPNGGGPIVKDKLWFYASWRSQENKRFIAGRYENLNEGKENLWLYAPDLSRPLIFSLNQDSGDGRLTYQAAQKHKITFFYDQQRRPWNDSTATNTSESANWWRFPRLRTTQAGWTSPLTNRLLLEVRMSNRGEVFQDAFEDQTPRRDLIGVLEQGGTVPGLWYRGHQSGSFTWNSMPTLTTMLGNVSYVTGSHALKFGVVDSFGHQVGAIRDNPTSLSYRFNNGVPNLIFMRATPYESDTRMRAEMGFFAQDKWTINKLTLTGGLRYDRLSYYYPPSDVGPGPLVPTRSFTTPLTESVNWKDMAPRFGVAYDLFGDGRTALKFSGGRYVVNADSGSATAPANPITGLSVAATRPWNDANGNFVPDCVLTNLLANGECGIVDDQNFGGRRPARADDPETYRGWFKREYNWEFSGSVSHQIVPKVGIEAGVFRRIFGNFVIQDNLATSASDYTQYSITAPSDPRLPGGGGYVVSGLYDLNPDKVGQVSNLVTFADNYGKMIEHWNGVDVSLNARPAKGVVVQGGLSTGRTSTDMCDIRSKIPELTQTALWSSFQIINPSSPYCHIDTNFLTQVKLLGTYLIPKIDLNFAATFQSLPGPQIGALVVYTSAQVTGSLGRPLSGGAPNITANVLDPGKYYVDRANMLDVRFGKSLRFGSRSVNLNLDIHNALNGNAVLLQNDNYAAWQRPQGILEGRLFKISSHIYF